MGLPTGILMAAGSGSRFGGGKLVFPVPPDNTPMAIVAYRHLRAALPAITVVVRPADLPVHAAFATEGVTPVVCERAAEGMGFSLARAVAATPDAEGWVIALGDMPSLRPETIRAVAEAIANGASIAVPVHDGRRGHPVGFAAEHRTALEALEGDAGARTVLAAHRDRIVEIAVADPGIHADIDTREEAEKLLAAKR